jgi:uncharacterized protein YeaO (DUF488 family)
MCSRERTVEMPRRREIRLRRVYDHEIGADVGYRVLVDRLWPRGVAKADAALDEWLREAAPSTELRRWYGHDVERFEEFTRRYIAELEAAARIDRGGPSRRTRPQGDGHAPHCHPGCRTLRCQGAPGAPSQSDVLILATRTRPCRPPPKMPWVDVIHSATHAAVHRVVGGAITLPSDIRCVICGT